MRVSKLLITALLAFLTSLPLAGGAGGQETTERLSHRARSKGSLEKTFSVAGTYTGAIKGEISIAGQSVYISEKTTIYVSGKGAVKHGVLVGDAHLYVGGTVKNGVHGATFVVVRSRTNPLSRPGAKQRDRNWRPLDTNSNLGYYDQSQGYVE